MKNSRTLRLVVSRGLLGTALLATPAFALTSAEIDSLRAKADRGNAIAQYNLGLVYADRRESVHDPVQAYVWLTLAANNGTNSKVLSELSAVLTPEQIAEGKRRIAAFGASANSPISAASPISPISAPDEVVAAKPGAVSAAVAPAAQEADADQKKLSAELSAAWEENKLLKSGLTAQLGDAKKRLAIAEAALASKDKEIAALQTRLAETPAPAAPSVAVVGPANPANEAVLTALRAERDQLKSAAATASTELATLRAASAKTSADQSALREKLAQTSDALAKAQRAQSLAESEAASLKASADRASADRLAVAAQVESLTTELAAAKAASAPASPETLSPAAVATLKADRDQLAESVKVLTEQRDDLAARLAASNQPRAQPQTNELELVQKRFEALTKFSDDQNTKLGAVTAERDALAVQLAAAKAVATAPAAAPVDDTRLAELQKEKADTDTKLAASLRSFTLQQAEIDRLQKALASIDEERAATAAKLDAANTELTAIRPQAASSAAVSADADKLRAELAAARQTISEQSASLAKANQSLADSRKTIDAATTELVATRDQLRQTQAQSAASAIEAQQLKTRLALSGNLSSVNTPSRPTQLAPVTVSLPSTTVPTTSAPEPAPAKVETPAAPRVHTVVSGDSLSRISKQYYGTANRWNDILQANKDAIRNPDALVLGTKLRIP